MQPHCAGVNAPGSYTGRGFGRGLGRSFGRGFGRGFGMGWGAPLVGAPNAVPYMPTMSPVDEKAFLTAQRDALDAQLKTLQSVLEGLTKRLTELEGSE